MLVVQSTCKVIYRQEVVIFSLVLNETTLIIVMISFSYLAACGRK